MPNLRNIKLVAFFIVVFFVLGLISCTKKSDETSNKDTDNGIAEMEAVSNDDFTESDEDLLKVDYKEFYDELAPHGEWIEVTDKDVGLDLKKGSASGENEHRKIGFAELFGIKDAHAYGDVSFGAFFVWKPSPNLAVSVVAGDPPVYVPYTNGQWVYTDAGWYFRAATPYEEICHHHGRWVYSPALGWMWVPGRVWAPAWVEWREHDSYIAWTPIPPSVYIVNSVVIVPPIFTVYTERYVIVERRYFLEPGIYKYHYKEHKNKIMIKEWRKIDGVTVMNKTVINKGPHVAYFEKIKGGKIETVKINKVKGMNNVKYSSNEFDVYTPEFKKSKTKGSVDKTVSKPNNSVKYENTSVKGDDKKTETPSGKDEGKDKGTGKDKVSGKEDKGKGNEKIKGEDKSKGKDKGTEDKGKYKEDKSKVDKKSDNGNMKDGKNKDGDNKPKGNDKGKGKNK